MKPKTSPAPSPPPTETPQPLLSAAELASGRAQPASGGWLGGWRLPQRLGALRHPNFRLYWFGQMVSLVGTWMQTVAQGWLVYQLSNSALALGLVGFANTVPVLLFSLLAGVLADRVNRRTIILTTQVLAACQAILLTLLVVNDVVQVWHIVLLAFTLGTINAFDVPARQSFLLEMVPKDDLMNAVALNATVFNTARVLGPAFAGGLVALVGPAVCFGINALSFIATIGAMWLIRTPPAPPRTQASSPWADLRAGVGYIQQEQPVRMLLTVIAITGAFGISYIALMPAFAADVLQVGPQGYGVLMSAVGAGALIGALTLASLGNYQHKGWLFTLGNICFPVALILFSVTRWLPLALPLLALAGASLMMQGTMANTLLQTIVPSELRGRVMSIYTMLFLGMTPLSNLQGGVVANTFGPPVAIAAGAVVCLTTALLVFWRYPVLRHMP